MRKVCLLFVLFFAHSGIAQTKLISFKSHSGNLKNFRIAVENNLFDIGASNFGNPQEDYYPVLDSVIFLSKDKSVFVFQRFGKLNKDTLSLPLLAKRHSLDSIKPLLKNYYRYSRDTKDIKFVGFDNNIAAYKKESKKEEKQAIKATRKQQKNLKQERKKSKQQAIPFVPANNKPSKSVLLLLLFALSSIVVYFSWKLNRFKQMAV
ncbi:MAG: DUF2956 family protein [Flavobacterium sp.]|nr:DUF2956 family protein [Flavobacterium sp.]